MQGLFDYAGSLERMGGDKQLFGEMVGFLLTDGPLWLEQVRQGIARQDANLVHRSAHTLKGLVANFGAQAAVAAAARIEQLAREDASLASARQALPALESAVEDLENALAPYHQPPDVAAR